MQLLFIILVFILIIFLLYSINVVHITALDPVDRVEIENRDKVRNMLLNKHVKTGSTDQTNTKTNATNNIIESFNNIKSSHKSNDSQYIKKQLSKIKSQYLNHDYKFNISNIPVRHLYHDMLSKSMLAKYTSAIHNSINNLNTKFNVAETKLLYIQETDMEFIINALVKLSYKSYNIYIKLSYYGFTNDSTTADPTYHLQLISFDIISEREFNSPKNNRSLDTVFMTMDQQLAYVEKINNMHANEGQI